ncbi:ribose-5-phosphate isomerase rki1 [Savitreella phatthalungensis]
MADSPKSTPRTPIEAGELHPEGYVSHVGMPARNANSERNIATLGSLRSLTRPPKMDHLALNDVQLPPTTSAAAAANTTTPRRAMITRNPSNMNAYKNASERKRRTADKATLTFPDPETLTPVEASKRLAARRAIDDHFPEDAKVIGIGSGSTIIYAVERILERDDTDNVVFVPTGFQSKELINGGGLRLGEVDGHPQIDVAFDGADEVDGELQCIKGGGACLFQEKLVASCARRFVIVADYRKNSKLLGEKWTQGLPIEVVPLAHAKVIRDLVALGAQSPQLRMGGKAKAGPVLTDNGNFVIDAPFPPGRDPKELLTSIKLLCGVVDCGLFVDMADVAYFGNEDGSVDIRYPDGRTEHLDAEAASDIDPDSLANSLADLKTTQQQQQHTDANDTTQQVVQAIALDTDTNARRLSTSAGKKPSRKSSVRLEPEARDPGYREYDRFELRR